ncbi:MAG: choice-of-anchor D domain-containing protein [Myxococcota bacterium]
MEPPIKVLLRRGSSGDYIRGAKEAAAGSGGLLGPVCCPMPHMKTSERSSGIMMVNPLSRTHDTPSWPSCPTRGGPMSHVRRSARTLRELLAAVSVSIVGVSGCTQATSEPGPPDLVVRLPDGDCHAGQECAFDFGALDVNSEHIRAFDVINLGESDDFIADIKIIGDPGFSVHASGPGTLAAGDSFPFAISVRPPDAVASTAHLEIRTRSSSSVIRVRLTVQGSVAGFAITPECDFGDVPVGTTSAPCDINLTNLGAGQVALDDLRVDNSVFQPNAAYPLGIAVPPNSTVTISMVATPLSTGSVVGHLLLRVETAVDFVTTLRVNGI